MVAMNFEPDLGFVLKSEGGYSDDPKDPGGATLNGITQRVYSAYLKKHGLPDAHVRNMHAAERDEIYRTEYWDEMGCDTLPSGLDYCVFDAAVNSGVSRAKEWLKESGKPASIQTFCSRRLSFLEGLDTWPHFGEGWETRVEFVLKTATAQAAGQPIHDTAWLQASLNKLGASPSLVIDGKEGGKTIAAIKAFQAKQGLKVDGLAGAKTLSALEAALGRIVPDEHIKTAARLSTAIYDYAEYPKEDWDHLITCKNGLYAGAKLVNGVWHISVRGSVTDMDWVHNLEFLTVNVPGIGHIAYGFNIDIAEFWTKVQAIVGDDPFVFSGHSRGAGEAKAAALYAKRDGKKPLALVVYGPPNIGYEEVEEQFNTFPYVAFRNTIGGDVDPVTKIPPNVLGIEPFVSGSFTDVSESQAPGNTMPSGPIIDFTPHFMPDYAVAVGGITLPLAKAA